MSIIKRLKTLWELSDIVEKEEVTQYIEEKARPPQIAQVIRKEDPVEEFLK